MHDRGRAHRSGRALLVAWFAVLITAPLAASSQVNATSDYLKRMDTDSDGKVSRAEFLDWMSYAFDARDADRDGVLSPQEQPGGKGSPITRMEHRERLSARFDKQDRNGDGILDVRELSAPPQ